MQKQASAGLSLELGERELPPAGACSNQLIMTESQGKPHVRVEARSGPESAVLVDAIADLRIAVFREYPYLYDGSRAYEREYLQSYFSCPESVCVLAWAGEDLIGVSTGLPLVSAEEAFIQPFRGADCPLERVFYFGESVLLAPWRGKGLGHQFFDARESWARQLGGFRWTAFCAVERQADHPMRPAGYRPLDGFWEKRGYIHHPELATRFSWKEINSETETLQKMTFWIRDWNRAAG